MYMIVALGIGKLMVDLLIVNSKHLSVVPSGNQFLEEATQES